jgi:hypothetical protein
MIKKFSNFKEERAQNEGLKKFTKTSTKVEDDNFVSDDSLDYDDEVNKQILAQEKPKGLADEQTNIKSTKEQVPTVDPTVTPNDTSIEHDKDYEPSEGPVNLDADGEEANESKVDMFGKVAKFPKGTKASKAINFLENVKLSKNRIWYIMVEKQDDELQMVKYDMKKGVNLSMFVNELKKHYISKYQDNPEVVAQLEKIELGGDREGNFSAIRNIPPIEVDGKKVITRITEDLIKLLSGKEK